MQIDKDILFTYGALTKIFKKGEYIFTKDCDPRFFFQVLAGEVKVISNNKDGKELIQGMFKAGDSFGEPPLFINQPYPCTAIAAVDSVIIKLSKERFLGIMDDYPGLCKDLLKTFATRIYNKSAALDILFCPTPEQKILGFFNKIKADINITTPYQIPHTRQQIADTTGLRVETVIRTLTKLKKEKKVDIINHKVFY